MDVMVDLAADMTTKEIRVHLDELIQHMRLQGVRINFKDRYWFWRILPASIEAAATTIGRTIWFSSDAEYERLYALYPTDLFILLAHEYVHVCDCLDMQDRFKVPYLYQFLYLCPQVLAVLLLLGGLGWAMAMNQWMYLGWMAMGAALCLVPWPAPFRYWAELRGCRMRYFVCHLVIPSRLLKTEQRIRSTLKSWLYYKMVWRSALVEEQIKMMTLSCDGGTMMLESRAFREVQRILR